MPCVIALVVFAVLGIFSSTHRQLAKEAFDCVFRRVTLRPCDTGFDKKVKARVLGSLITRSPKLTKLVNQRFELLAWILAVGLTASSMWTAVGLYRYWAWGSCNGLNAGGFCAFDPTGKHNQVSTTTTDCVDVELAQKALSLAGLDLSQFVKRESNGEKQLVFIGCYSCDLTRKTYPLIQKLIGKMPVDYYFIHFPVKTETTYLTNYDYCVQENYPDKYPVYTDALFGLSKEELTSESKVLETLVALGMEKEKLTTCTAAESTQSKVKERLAMIEGTGIYGTPTIFIGDKAVVGPKPYRVYRRLAQGSWW